MIEKTNFTLTDYVQFCEKVGEYDRFFEFADEQIYDRHGGKIVPFQVVNAILQTQIQDLTNIYQTTMATFFHRLIANNLQLLLLSLLSADFRIYADGCNVYIALKNRSRIPDLLLVDANDEQINEYQQTTNPLLVVEVLSPSTEQIDFTKKLEEYKSIPSLQEYLIISQTEAKIWQYSRQKNVWLETVYEGINEILSIDFLNIVLPLSKIYRNVKF